MTQLEKEAQEIPGPAAYSLPDGCGYQPNSIHRSNLAVRFGPREADAGGGLLADASSERPSASLRGAQAREANLSDATIERIRQKLRPGRAAAETLFAMWDTDGDGTIDRRELCRGLNALGIFLSHEELRLVFETLDADGSNSLDSKELFEILWGKKRSEGQRRSIRGLPCMTPTLPTSC